MKKLSILTAGLACAALTSCGGLGTTSSSTTTTSGSTAGTILGNVLGAITNTDGLTNAISSVIGTDKPTTAQLYGTWNYTQPGVAFTSEQTLAKAGGEIIASQIKSKLKDGYSKVGIKKANTSITFNEDKTFSAKIDGKAISGTYTYDESTCQITLQTLLLSMPCYAQKTSNGLSVLFESKKFLTLLQTAAALSGNTSLQTIGDISKSYSGVRMGFDMSK